MDNGYRGEDGAEDENRDVYVRYAQKVLVHVVSCERIVINGASPCFRVLASCFRIPGWQ